MSGPNAEESASQNADVRQQLSDVKNRIAQVRKAQLLYVTAVRQATGGTLVPTDISVTALERRPSGLFGRPGHIIIRDVGSDRDSVIMADFDEADNDVYYADKDHVDHIHTGDKDAHDLP